ncbi:sigma 54-interacting transcriptional regulator [Bradyrhizobium ganzhouense]|uniref:sigma 54-interacting transcriptional regulator n=1 Tax=Bradyrhizobium ganzhouense TaxID=1179767 RepID=UPI003CEBA61D
MAPPDRISLAEIREKAKLFGTSADLDEGSSPTVRELSECLSFSPGDGRIWLDEQRMMLVHCASMGTLRHEMIETIGTERTRAMLTRVGFASGVRDAELIQKRWPNSHPSIVFAAGPRLHSLEGVVKVVPVRFDFDIGAGSFYGEFLWHDSSEDEEHIRRYGIGSEPVCWMQLGYASGYATAFMGKMIIYREVECRAMGAPHCRNVGKPAGEWDNSEEDLRYFNADLFAQSRLVGNTAAVAPARRNTHKSTEDPVQLVGASGSFNVVRHLVDRVASTDATVLFIGESGVGKEIFARTLHRVSKRSTRPFIALNCAAIPENLIESELFGVEKGAFTGATASRPGRFERANSGTLFLDEVGSLSMVAQGKLLRAVQEREVERVGGTKTIPVNVRIVAASNRDLREEVKAGRFREDLFFRLNVFPINIPPLRERRDDIPLLMEAFANRYCELHGKQVTGFTQRAVEALLRYDFPGNIRELQNILERAVILTPDGFPVDVSHLSLGETKPQFEGLSLGAAGRLTLETAIGSARAPAEKLAGPGISSTGTFSFADHEAQIYLAALEATRGNVSAAAKSIGLSRAQLAYRLKRQSEARRPR